MKTHFKAYGVLLLAAAVLSMIPPILWMDFVAPYSAYDVWQRRGNELTFRLNGKAAKADGLDTRVRVFKALVAPTVIPTYFGIHRSEYTRFAFPDGLSNELAGIAPTRIAFDFLFVAIPTWFVILAILFELGGLVGRRPTAA